jgi:HTH-type transcriptional regulator/antitoxin HigA
MELKPITTEQEHQAILDWVDRQFDAGVQKGSAEGNLLEVALMLIKDYEDKHYLIPEPY